MANPFAGGNNYSMYKGKREPDDLEKSNRASRVDFSDEKIGPKFKADKAKAKPKAKATYKKLKDTSGDYFTPTESGEMGSAMGEVGADMGMVNKANRDIDYSGMSRMASDEDAAKVDLKSSGKADYVDPHEQARRSMGFKKGGAVKKMAKGGKVSSASSRGDGCAQRGKTRGRMV